MPNIGYCKCRKETPKQTSFLICHKLIKNRYQNDHVYFIFQKYKKKYAEVSSGFRP